MWEMYSFGCQGVGKNEEIASKCYLLIKSSIEKTWAITHPIFHASKHTALKLFI